VCNCRGGGRLSTQCWLCSFVTPLWGLPFMQGSVSEANPHLIFHNFKTRLVRAVCCSPPASAAACAHLLYCAHGESVRGLKCGLRCGAQGLRLQTILKHLFPVPKPDSKRVITFANDSDFVSFRHHTYKKTAGSKDVDLVEVRLCVVCLCVYEPSDALPSAGPTVCFSAQRALWCVRQCWHHPVCFFVRQVGPRFEMRPFRVMLGTADQDDAADEWVMRPYMNTARKKDAV
jgi:rRNA maturation protein Rpf1